MTTYHSNSIIKMSMSPLVKALEKIDYWIKNSNSKHAERIRGEYDYRLTGTPLESNEYTPQPGIEKEMLELYAEDIDFKLSEEIYELYEWHDGNFIIGDISNPVYFVSFESSFCHYTEQTRSFPIFIGDEIYYFVKEAKKNENFSTIYVYDGRPFLQYQNHVEVYAPNITCYVLAMAECIETYNEICISYSDYYAERRKYIPLFSNIYKKYGVNTEGNVIWG